MAGTHMALDIRIAGRYRLGSQDRQRQLWRHLPGCEASLMLRMGMTMRPCQQGPSRRQQDCSAPESMHLPCCCPRRHSYPDRRGGRHQVGEGHSAAMCAPCMLCSNLPYWALHRGVRLCAPQESVKTKHPQLLYESKLYKILQGGSASLHACLPSACALVRVLPL